MKRYTLELYRVQIECKDRIAYDNWEEECKKGVQLDKVPPLLPPKKTTYHAAVSPDFGGDPLKRAADLAITSVVGERDCWEEWQPIVASVECLGSVVVEGVDRNGRLGSAGKPT